MQSSLCEMFVGKQECNLHHKYLCNFGSLPLSIFAVNLDTSTNLSACKHELLLIKHELQHKMSVLLKWKWKKSDKDLQACYCFNPSFWTKELLDVMQSRVGTGYTDLITWGIMLHRNGSSGAMGNWAALGLFTGTLKGPNKPIFVIGAVPFIWENLEKPQK